MCKSMTVGPLGNFAEKRPFARRGRNRPRGPVDPARTAAKESAKETAVTPSPQTQNRLAAATSPYLQQHAGNPVDWYEWGAAALETARREDKPIFLSIG